MTMLMKVHSLATGETFSRPMWLHSFDVDREPTAAGSSYFLDDGCAVINGVWGGKIILTPRRKEALRFDTSAEAMIAWNRISVTYPRRPDGKPNKPLTALTVEIEPCDRSR